MPLDRIENEARTWGMPAPNPNRLTVLAFRTLDDALDEAATGPVKRNAGHRLALAWLASQNAGLDWHYKAFWDAMALNKGGGINDGGNYIRGTTMRSLLHYWKTTLRFPT